MNQDPSKQHPTRRPQHQQAQQQHAEHEEDEDGEELEVANRFLFFNIMPSWMVSFVTHVALIILISIWWLPGKEDTGIDVIGTEATEQAEEDSVDVKFDPVEDPEEEVLEAANQTEITDEVVPTTVDVPEVFQDVAEAEFGDVTIGDESFVSDALFSETALSGGETSGRGKDARGAQLRKNGGGKDTEAAVELALQWIAKHQLPDGSWSLDHTVGPGNERDKNNPGSRDSARAGATALAILPFLGQGHTHTGDSKYKKVVRAGLEYLMKRGVVKGRGISWHEPGGTMYSHGLVSIVFTEAYAMTEDSQLAAFAQGSIWFIEDAQDPNGGGWRYALREAGDTSAVGWQIMAIKSGRSSGLDFNKKTIKLAEKFLNSVSVSDGAFYGYTSAPKLNKNGTPLVRKALTSVGLLCRMYMGWDRDRPGLNQGVEFLRRNGPSVGSKNRPQSVDMYYNYYATQVMKQWDGSQWEEWNRVMKKFLVESQEKEGTKRGSWHWSGNNHSTNAGGRLYNTALAAMTLEVYYRYLPLYNNNGDEDDFELK